MANPNIFQQYLQPVRSVQDYANDYDIADARKAQLQSLQGQNALQALTLQQNTQSAQQAMAERNALQRIAAGSGGDRQALISGLRNSGMPGLMTQADSLEQSGAKLQESQSTAKKNNADADSTSYKTQIAKSDRAIADISNLSDPQAALASLQAHKAAGDLDDIKYQSVLSTLQPALQDPSQFQKWKRNMVLGIMDAKDRLLATAPKVTMANAGGSLVPVNENADAGPVGPIAGAARVQVTQSPDNAATVAASMANAGALRDQAQATRDAANIQTGFSNEQGLRKEFEGLPEIRNYKQAYPAFAAIKDAAARSTPQADINLVYGIAKLYDPNSVVREGEYATVANSPSIPERVKGYAQFLAGGGKLSPDTKKQILAEAQGRMDSYKAEADKARGSYDGIAKRRGIDPANVFQDMGDIGKAPAANAAKVVNFSDLK